MDQKWLVRFNPVKTEAFLASRKLNKPIHPPLLMEGTQIVEVESHKHLRLIIKSDCSWHNHIDCVKEKAWSRVNAMKKLVWFRQKAFRNCLSYFHQTHSRIRGYGLGQLYPVREKWTRENPEWGGKNSYWDHLTCFNQSLVSFLPSVIREWNNLPLDVRNSDSVNSFKRRLNDRDRYIPKYYYSGNRKLQILHTRLPTGCCSINHDLFLKHITDSPLYRCGEIETTEH